MSSNKEKFERDFDAFLNEGDAELSALYRKLPQAEPDAKLDAAVLAMAHRALNPHLVATAPAQRKSAARRRARWIPLLSGAATVVFAVGVAVKMGPQLWTERSAPPAPARSADQGVIHVRPVDLPAAAPEPPLSPPPPVANTSAGSARQELARAAPKPEPQPADEQLAQTAAATPPPPPEPPPASPEPPPAPPAPAPTAMTESVAPPSPPATEPPPAPAPPAGAAAAGFEQPPVEAERLKKAAAAPQAFPAPTPSRNNTQMDAVERKETMAEGAWQRLHDGDTPPAAAAKTARTQAAPAPAPDKPAPDKRVVDQAPADRYRESRSAPPPPPARTVAPPRAAETAPAPATTAAPAAFAGAPANAPAANAAPALREAPTPADRGALQAGATADKEQTEKQGLGGGRDATLETRTVTGTALPPAAAREQPAPLGVVEEKPAKPSSPEQAAAKAEAPADFTAQPQTWVAAMQKMLSDGRRVDLKRNLRLFRQQYPDYRLPPELERFARESR